MRIIIVGVGGLGEELAGNLINKERTELVLVDSDEKRCDALASKLDALVINGDGTDPEILKKAQISEADVLIATTGSDPLNTVIAMLGRRLKVNKIIVKLNGLGLRSACQGIGVQKIIAPKVSAVAEILSAVYGFDKVDFSLVGRGGLRLVELEAGRATGRHVQDLALPDGSHFVAISRGEQVMLPHGNMKLQDDDKLLVLVEDEKSLNKMKANFAREEEQN